MDMLKNALNAHFKHKKSTADGDDFSSDDENGTGTNISDSCQITEEYIKNGKSGVIVFHNVKCIKTGLFKTFHLHLYECVLEQFTGLISKKYPCKDIVEISKSSKADEPDIVIIKVKHNMKMASVKKFTFDYEINYTKFKHYVAQIKDIGGFARQAFDRIDVRNSGCIYPSNLKEGLHGLGLSATDEDITKMLSISLDDSQVCHYEEFYHLFAKLEVTSVRECLHSWLYQAKALQHTDEKAEFRRNHVVQGVKRLPGEDILLTVDKCRWSIYYGSKPKKNELFSGRIYITSYRVYLATYFPNFGYCHSCIDIPMYFDRISLPLSSIYRVQTGDSNELIITGKDNRIMRIEIINSQQSIEPPKAENVAQQLSKVAFKQKKETLRNYAFAYKYFERVGMEEFAFNGWTFSEIRREYARQGLTNSVLYKLINNSQYQVTETYPQWLAVPTKLDIDIIMKAVKHRSKNRFPVITYRHPSGVLLLRSAQPISGLTNSCPEDEKLLNCYRTKCTPDSKLENDAKFYIFDARRLIAATANRMAGKGGTENAAAYVNTELIHCNIDNIHVMRGSYDTLGELVSPGIQFETLMSENVGGVGFFQKLEDCGWLRYIHLLLLSCVRIASKIHLEGSSCLVHCSDGWDRTAQLCSITQIILDPYFRSLDGIATLIEKEWCSFGFKFNERCGHHADYSHKSSERSPIFVQFIDSLFQIVNQFPTSFEFNEYFLIFLCDHQFSGLFGTFLCDYDKMKEELEVKQSTISIWSYIFKHKDRFINPKYVEFPSPIWPSYNLSKLKLWERFHMRWNPDTHPNSIDGVGWSEDWGVGFETNVDSRNVEAIASVEVRRPPENVDLEDFNYASVSFTSSSSRAPSIAIENDNNTDQASRSKSGFSWTPKSVLPTVMTGSQPRCPPGSDFMRSGSMPVSSSSHSSPKMSLFNRSGSVNSSTSASPSRSNSAVGPQGVSLNRDQNTRNLAVESLQDCDDEDDTLPTVSPSQRSISIAGVSARANALLASFANLGSSSVKSPPPPPPPPPPAKPQRYNKSPPKPPRSSRGKSDASVTALEMDEDGPNDVENDEVDSSTSTKQTSRNFSSAAIRAMGAEIRQSNSHINVVSLEVDDDCETSHSLPHSAMGDEEEEAVRDEDRGRESFVIGISSIDRETITLRHSNSSIDRK